jgi:hypothetical protein
MISGVEDIPPGKTFAEMFSRDESGQAQSCQLELILFLGRPDAYARH